MGINLAHMSSRLLRNACYDNGNGTEEEENENEERHVCRSVLFTICEMLTPQIIIIKTCDKFDSYTHFSDDNLIWVFGYRN